LRRSPDRTGRLLKKAPLEAATRAISEIAPVIPGGASFIDLFHSRFLIDSFSHNRI